LTDEQWADKDLWYQGSRLSGRVEDYESGGVDFMSESNHSLSVDGFNRRVDSIHQWMAQYDMSDLLRADIFSGRRSSEESRMKTVRGWLRRINQKREQSELEPLTYRELRDWFIEQGDL